MTQQELVSEILKGRPLVLVEYRSFKEDVIRYRDKKTGNAIEQSILKHSVEMGSSQVLVSEWLPQDHKKGTASSPYRKGEIVAFEIEGMESQQGFYKAQGKLLPFQPDAVKK